MPVFPEAPEAPGTPGELVEDDFQYEFRSFVFGAGTPFVVEKVTGLLGSPSTNSDDVDKAHDHGAHPGMLLYGKRILAFDLKVRGSAGLDIEDKLEEMRRAFQAPRVRYSKIPEPFFFMRPGGVKKVIYARCTKRDFDSDYKTARGLAVGSVELQATDPLVYAVTPLHGELTLAPGQPSGTVIVTQLGSHIDGAPPVLEISGAATNPIVESETDDFRAVRLDVVLGANDAVRIDVGKKIVWHRVGLGGEWVRNYSIWRNDSQWFNLLPGPNTINFSRTGATATTLDIDWRDVWS